MDSIFQERGNSHDQKGNVQQNSAVLGFHAIGKRYGCRTISTRQCGTTRTTAAKHAQSTTCKPEYRHHGTG